MGSVPVIDLEDELEGLFIAETFHKSEPIRSKPIQTIIPRVVIKEKKRKTEIDGVIVKVEPPPKKTLNDRFVEMQINRHSAGIVFETELEDNEAGDENIEDYDDITVEEQVLTGSSGMSRTTRSKMTINLAKKLKRKAIANRLGIAYNPSNRLKGLKSRRNEKPKTWVEKFGQLLAAKKLLYLPLLFRKYNMGPKMSKEELDIEIDLYMSEVKKTKRLKLAYKQVSAAVNGEDQDGIQVVSTKLFSGFGGPGWKKRVKAEVKPDKDKLDMEIDIYMANKGERKKISFSDPQSKDELDLELEEYMASVKNKVNGTAPLVNGFH